MNKLIKLSASLLIILIISCSEKGPNEPEENLNYQNELIKLFPHNTNIIYEFDLDTLAQTISVFKQVGKRFYEIVKKEIVSNEEYYSADHNFLYTNSEEKKFTNFRFTNNSLFFLTDTSGVTEGIADSLLEIMTIKVDPEIKLLEMPLIKNKTWPVVKAVVDFQTFKFNTIDVVGEYIGKEEVFLNGLNKALPSEKVRYKLDINVPNFENPFLSNTKSYYAEIWFAEDYGVIKMEGCSFILNPVVGKNMNFIDTNKVSRQVLTNIKNK